MKTISIGVLNIVLPPPHSPETYIALWRAAFKKRKPVMIRGDVGGMIGSLKRESEFEWISGDLYKFLNIDNNGKWLDLSTTEPAAAEDVAQNVSIPPHYRPNLRSLPYIFVPEKHRLLFISRLDQSNNLSPSMAKNLVERLLNSAELQKVYGEVTVTIEPAYDSLDRIFELQQIRSLKIEVSPPNALGDVERELFDWLDEQNATNFKQELESNSADGLQPTEKVKEIAEVAKSNGFVEGRGKNEDGRVVTLSTKDHPFEERLIFDQKIQNLLDAFVEAVPSILGKILNKVRRRRKG
ncbi:DUF4747 family protein [Janthinobacterium sp. J1-1]|uniref:DUF4747 family protein n=1 Tax=unclassified Janthinobacterium TaxID=2610881 RepID=UPI002810AC6E|nr:DUF4747 family protein [Janthinobacterium sp. J1-1]